ncbi:MAG: response regulator [Candidatus Omnitrophota bacterium]
MQGKDKISILIVDDSLTVRESMLEELRVLGYEVQAVSCVAEAREVLDEKAFDVLFLDLKLPNVQGLDYLDELKKEKRDIVVIVMTAYESSGTAVEAIEKGAHDYVIKPIEPAHFELIIKRALKRYQLENEKQAAIDKRIQALADFMETSRDVNIEIAELKKEVNSLLVELGRPVKYKVIN